MAAIVTDQFRILNANNFVETVDNSANSYYVVVGLVNPTHHPLVLEEVLHGIQTHLHQKIVLIILIILEILMIFGKKVTSDNIRR